MFAFHSHAEQIYTVISMVCMSLHLGYLTWLKFGKNDFAKMLQRSYMVSLATIHSKKGVFGYLAYSAVAIAFYCGVMAGLHWYDVIYFTLAIASFIVPLTVFLMIKASKDPAIVSEAIIFGSYDLRAYNASFK